jgi:hypothetical protein
MMIVNNASKTKNLCLYFIVLILFLTNSIKQYQLIEIRIMSQVIGLRKNGKMAGGGNSVSTSVSPITSLSMVIVVTAA